ncbi:glycosyltransferase [Patescibacteria group bacterium]|nr:glycosyltransferase [Patescibacteria group bacterium]
MKVSFVTTILNEEKSIKDLLDSLVAQIKKPDEVIIVDAGSTDKTLQLIKPYQKNLIIRIIKLKGANRSQGRNRGIKLAKNQIIAVSDAGCTLDKNWLKQITKPLEKSKTDSVAGFYQVKANSIFQRCLSPFVATMPDKFDQKTYLPSSRSLTFKKSAWQKAGQYPEVLNYCEDLVFAKNLKEKTIMKVEPKALVYWQMPTSLFSFFNQIKNYAYGDIKADFLPHRKKILSIYLRYFIFFILPFGYLLYLIFTIIKFYKYINHPLAVIYLPIIRVVVDIAMILGSLKGKIHS